MGSEDDRAAAGARTEGRAETVLVATAPGRDRDLLTGWLAEHSRYTVLTELEEATPESYDLAIVDPEMLNRHEARLREHVERADPVFLPVLLTVSADTGETPHDAVPPELADLVDDVVALPVRQAELARRIETLLKTRRASLRLADRESQYRTLVESTPEPILLVRDRTVIYGNAAAAAMLGAREADAFVDRSITDLVASADEATIEDVLGEIEREGSISTYTTCQFVGLDGTEAIGDVAGVRVTFGSEPTTQLLVRDVTAERARQRRLDLFGRAIDAAAQGVTIADAQAEDEPLIYANDAFERITGYQAPEILGRNCRFLQGENTDPETVRALREAIAAREPVAVEIRNYRKDGGPFWNELEIVPITDEQGTVTHFLGLQSDITARREREEQLAVMSRVLRHNIRNRVNVIKGRAEQLEDATQAAQIGAAADDLLGLSERFRQFRTLSAAEGDRLQVVDLGARLAAVEVGLREEYPDADLHVETPASVLVRSHPLLVSALEAILQRILGGDPEAALTLGITREDNGVRVILEDRGQSMSRTALDAVAAGAESPIDHPRGIELWLLRWVVQRSGGEFSVRDPHTTRAIQFTLPEADPESSDAL